MAAFVSVLRLETNRTAKAAKYTRTPGIECGYFISLACVTSRPGDPGANDYEHDEKRISHERGPGVGRHRPAELCGFGGGHKGGGGCQGEEGGRRNQGGGPEEGEFGDRRQGRTARPS